MAAYWHIDNCISFAERCVYMSQHGEKQQGSELSGKLIQSEQGNRVELEVLPSKASMGIGATFIYDGFPAVHFSSKIAVIAGRVSCHHPWKKMYLLSAVWTPSHWEDFCEWKKELQPRIWAQHGPHSRRMRARGQCHYYFLETPQGAGSMTPTLKLWCLKSKQLNQLMARIKIFKPCFFSSHLIHLTFPPPDPKLSWKSQRWVWQIPGWFLLLLEHCTNLCLGFGSSAHGTLQIIQGK